MQDEVKRKRFIQKTFNMVAQDYGLRASRFFHLSGEIMAELLALSGDESVLDVASGIGHRSDGPSSGKEVATWRGHCARFLFRKINTC